MARTKTAGGTPEKNFMQAQAEDDRRDAITKRLAGAADDAADDVSELVVTHKLAATSHDHDTVIAALRHAANLGAALCDRFRAALRDARAMPALRDEIRRRAAAVEARARVDKKSP
jgi:hypothetical protein